MTAMVRAGGLRGYRELVRVLGGDPAALLRRHGVTAETLEDEDALLPLRQVIHLLEDSAARLNRPDFGLRLAQVQDIGILGPLAVAMQNAPTVGEAMSCASRYLFVQSPGIALTLLPRSPGHPGWAELRYEILLSHLPQSRQTVELGLRVAHRVLTMLAPQHYRLREVQLPHAPLAPPAAYARAFGVRLRSACPHAALRFDRGALDAPMQSVNASLRQMAMSYIEAQFPSPGQSVGARVRHAVSRTLGTGHSRKEAIAAMLAMHPRTLQRRLAAEGTSFEAIHDAVCREAALRYLGGTRMPLSQVAGLLGLARQSALTRACRRWFGSSPTQVRASSRAGSAASLEPPHG